MKCHRPIGLALCACLLAGCSSKPPGPPQPASPVAATSPSAPAQPAPGQASGQPGQAPAKTDCGPAVPEQADNVRVAVLEDLIVRAEADALQQQVKLGPIVLAQEERLQGARSIFVRDVAPEVLERFAGRTPPVGNYSAAFVVEGNRAVRTEAPVAFSTGEICWVTPARAVVDARRLSSTANSPFRATVELVDGKWKVTSLADRTAAAR